MIVKYQLMHCDNMKFKPNRYYCVIHKDFGWKHPSKCIIKTNVCLKKEPIHIWEIKVITICDAPNDSSCRYHEGLATHWYEEWCEILIEFKNKPNECEILACVL